MEAFFCAKKGLAFGAAFKENKDGSNPYRQRIAAILFLLRLFSSKDCFRNFQEEKKKRRKEEKKKSKNEDFFLENCFCQSLFLLAWRFCLFYKPYCRAIGQDFRRTLHDGACGVPYAQNGIGPSFLCLFHHPLCAMRLESSIISV